MAASILAGFCRQAKKGVAGLTEPNPTGDKVLHARNGMQVVAFDAEGNRYKLKGRAFGQDLYCLLRFRLDPAELARNKVEYVGVEQHNAYSAH